MEWPELLYNTDAIVIRQTPYGETHAIIQLLTLQGTVSAMARGAKRPQSRLAAGVQICVEGTYTIYQNRGMGNVQQFEMLNARRPLREQLDLAAYAAYFCELVAAVATDRPNGSEAVYRQFTSALDRLVDRANTPADICRMWECKVLRWLGVAPDWLMCTECGEQHPEATAYDPTKGGFICGGCEKRVRQSGRILRVPPGVSVILSRMERAPLERIGKVTLSQPMQEAVDNVIRVQMQEYGGLRFKSKAVLDSLEFPGM